MAVESTASTALSAPVTSPSPHVVDGMAHEPLSLPFGDMALRADFDRQGPDLVIEGLEISVDTRLHISPNGVMASRLLMSGQTLTFRMQHTRAVTLRM